MLIHLIVATKIATPVLTLPSGEMVPDAISALWKEDLVDRIELGPLSCEETTELLEAVLRGPLDATSEHGLWSLTVGNPLYLTELVLQRGMEGTLRACDGLWRWDGRLSLGARLTELIDRRIRDFGHPPDRSSQSLR